MSIVAIVGRPNVGKSTLFNRLVGKRAAIVGRKSGLTRDRNYGFSQYHGYEFIVIDTGGYENYKRNPIENKIAQQSRIAIEEADCVLFLVDAQEGCSDSDSELYRYFLKMGSKIFVVVNKVDNDHLEADSFDFFKLGVEVIFPISAEHNKGINELLEAIDKEISLKIKKNEILLAEILDYCRPIQVAVIGKPNAGKSSIINRMIGENRMIVDSASGTTRDPVDSLFKHRGKDYIFVDTAGIRRRGKVSHKLETVSIVSAIKSIAVSYTHLTLPTKRIV